MIDHCQTEKQRYLDNCTRCGLCAKGCPILPLTDLASASTREIQEAVYTFCNEGTPSPAAYTKAFACMECFKCTAGMCPEGLDPMRVNEIVKAEYVARGLAEKVYSDPAAADSAHRVLAALQVTAEDYRRLTAAGEEQTARIVFFPGCNLYFQPELILDALDILNAIGDDWAFLPGLDHCCGDSLFFTGDIEAGAAKTEALVETLAAFQPDTVVLWCPTCQCRFHQSVAPAMKLPFEILSFPQYLAARMDRLALTDAAAGTVTLHEACKSAFTGVDPDGPRRVLGQLPGVNFLEMAHHGRRTMCCGSGAVAWFPESFARMRDLRLAEAADTGAGRMVTVCHYCNQAFLTAPGRYDFEVVSYVRLVAAALGIHRESRFQRYARGADPERILADAASFAKHLPFAPERILAVLHAVFGH